jgi:NTP pyrophosphatase (non-canonical NTP hydrolase)
MSNPSLNSLADQVHEFVAAREWCDGHNPKNLAMAISVEAAELSQVFQWLTPEEAAGVRIDEELLTATTEEIGDVLILLLSLCNSLGVDPSAAIVDKLRKNERKYPLPYYKGRDSVRRPTAIPFTCKLCLRREPSRS